MAKGHLAALRYISWCEYRGAAKRSLIMRRFSCTLIIGVAAAALMSFSPNPAYAQDDRPLHVDDAVRAVMQTLGTEDDAALYDLVDTHMTDLDQPERESAVAKLRDVRTAARGAGGDVNVEAEDDGIRLVLSGNGSTTQIKLAVSRAGVTDVSLVGNEKTAAAPGLQSRDDAVRGHSRALEESGFTPLDQFVVDFEDNHLSAEYLASTTPQDRKSLLSEIRDIAKDAGGALLNEDDGVIILTLEGPEGAADIRFTAETSAPYSVATIKVERGNTAPAIELSLDQLDQQLAALETQGLSGAVLMRIDGETVHRKAYGFANPQTERENTIDTMFGVGSRPIDFTIAAIYLLDQRGVISRKDPITEYFDNVPEGKKTMTLSHLMRGESGLPDFHGLPTDWDQDLAWIDRETAVQRILDQPLLFAPGTGNRHSHSAFGLLASVVETESGMGYYEFLRRNFFDPAGMNHTGEYGELRGQAIEDFAVGGGPSFVGEPNVPPNWGNTSWLVKGSGGMYSNLDDLMKFYDYIRTSGVLEPEYTRYFKGSSVSVDGSDRGFELYSSRDDDGADEVYLVVNMRGNSSMFRDLSRALNRLIEKH